MGRPAGSADHSDPVEHAGTGEVHTPVPRRTAASIALGTLLNPLNSSMIAVALVALQREFRVGVGASSWLISGFYLAACVAQPLMGRIADRFGPRRVYCTGLVIVGMSGIAALLSPGFGWLVLCRVTQAIGSSAAFPSGLALIRRIAGGGKPPAATLASISITNSASAAFGPVLGGFLVAVAGWRGIFAVNIPLSAVGLVLALRWLPGDHETRPPDSGRQPNSARSLVTALDLPGVALFGATIIGLLGFLLSVGGQIQWWALALVPVGAALLVWRETRTPAPFLDVRGLARNAALLSVLGQQVAVQLVYYAVFFGLPMWLERVRGFPAESAGLLMLPVAALGVLFTPVAARIISRRGPRIPLVAGSVGLLTGSAALLLISDSTPVIGIVAIGMVLGLPNGFNNMGLQAALYQSAPPEQTGTAGGLFQTGRYVGAILSTALLGVVFAHDFTTGGLHRVALVTTAFAVPVVLAAIQLSRQVGRPSGAVPATPPAPAAPS